MNRILRKLRLEIGELRDAVHRDQRAAKAAKDAEIAAYLRSRARTYSILASELELEFDDLERSAA